MNYRHHFHAGNFADVFKHVLLLHILGALCQKEPGFIAVDTHAGAGLYDLKGHEAKRSGEFRDGVVKIFLQSNCPAIIKDYMSLIKAINSKHGESEALRYYPGSPLVIAQSLRPQDKFIAYDISKDVTIELARSLHHYSKASVVMKDGYKGLAQLLPPRDYKRGVFLIDPPFESGEDFDNIVNVLGRGIKKFHQGIFIVWYAIKGVVPVHLFYDQVASLKKGETLAVEFFMRPPTDPLQFNGCGLLIVNPPFSLQKELAEIMDHLVKALGNNESYWQQQWL